MNRTVVIPEIDISALVIDEAEPKQLEKALSEIDNTCRNIGFMSVINHGVSPELIERMEKAAFEFFYLPQCIKQKASPRKFNPTNSHVYRGYIPAAVFGKECLDIADPLHTGEDDSNNILFESAKFPPELSKGSRAVLEEYYGALHRLSVTLVKAVFRIFGGDERKVEELSRRPDMPTLRLNYYPQHVEGYAASEISAQDGVKLACETHTDSGLFTILYQDTVGGLQVQDPKTKEWIDVSCNRKAFVVNTGLAMQMLTNDRYKATFHRVRMGTSERLSVPYFFSGAVDAKIDSTFLTPKEERKYSVITYKEHMLKRLKAFQEYQRD